MGIIALVAAYVCVVLVLRPEETVYEKIGLGKPLIGFFGAIFYAMILVHFITVVRAFAKEVERRRSDKEMYEKILFGN